MFLGCFGCFGFGLEGLGAPLIRESFAYIVVRDPIGELSNLRSPLGSLLLECRISVGDPQRDPQPRELGAFPGCGSKKIFI